MTEPIDGVWISQVPAARVAARMAAARAGAVDPALPLAGLTFSVKDNFDVAGMETTAGCPEFGYVADHSAEVVRRLEDAGAILVGKTNLDQFATGLSGTRSPYGVVASVADPTLIAGGSSSGSAVSVAAGLVDFSIGSDTAGSGRVPAALNGIVGIKPSIGLVSTHGLVPACRSLDCVSIFAANVAAGARVLSVITTSNIVELPARRDGLRLGVPARITRWGARGEQDAWEAFCARLVADGVTLVPVAMEPFLEAGRVLYDGPWIAERLSGVAEFVRAKPETLLEVTREILLAGEQIGAVEAFAAQARLGELREAVSAVLDSVDALLTPTVTETFTIEEMLADPIVLNARLGTFTSFTNLLDLCAVALPVSPVPSGVPFGVTVQAAAGRDGRVLAIARALAGEEPAPAPADDRLRLAVVGAHLSGMPLHSDLVGRGAELESRTTTAPAYRLYALPGGPPYRPGLERVEVGGAAVEVEVYRMPREQMGDFLAGVPAPLGIGRVLLANGDEVLGFICEPVGLTGATDITSYGGWRAYLASQ